MILSKVNTIAINIDQLIEDHLHQKIIDEILIIVPTNRKIRYLKRQLISLTPNKATSRLHLYTLETFCTKIFQKLNGFNKHIISDATAAVLLDRAFRKAELKYFSNYTDGIPRGTLDRIKNVISEYKRNGISPEKIYEESKKLSGSEKLKAQDISNIFKIYQNDCKQLKAYETGDIYSAILDLDKNDFKNYFNVIFRGIRKTIINGFDEFTLPEIDIIERVSEIDGRDLFVVFDYFKFNPALFSHLNSCYESLKSKGFKEIEDLSAAHSKFYQKRLRENLFLLKETDETVKSEIGVTKIIASTPAEEAKLIAKEIKNLIVNKDVSPDAICVAYNLISDHSKILRDAFNDYGIPFNLTDRFSLSESQPIIALINFLEILENDYYYKNIFRALTGRWISVKGIELANLLRVSSNLKIVSGYDNWCDSIDRAISEIQNLSDDDENRFLPLEFYVSAKENIENIHQLLKPFNAKLKVDDFLKLMRKLIFDLKLSEKIINDHPSQIEKNVKAITIFLQTIEEIFGLIKSENGNDKKYPLKFFINNIKTGLQFTRYNIKERHGSGVLVTSVNEIRGLNFDYVFIGGLVDGEFPTRFQPEIFFSGSFKKEEYKHNLEERYHFYQALCNVNKELYLCYYTKDEKKEYIVSTFLIDFCRIFLTFEKSRKDYENFIYSKAELLTLAGHSSNQELVSKISSAEISKDTLNNDIEINKLRLRDSFEESPFNGYIFSELSYNAKTKLNEHSSKQFSISMLEGYAKCPFQYFLNRILFLETIEEPTEEIESFELGTLVHSILFEFYRTIKEENIELKKCDDETFHKAEKLIFEIANRKIERLNLRSPLIFIENEKILGLAGNKRNSILYKFLEEERQNEDGFVPTFFEIQFGKFENQNTEPIEVKVGDVKVRGKIDRIDVDYEQKKFNVIDYKLNGKTPTKKDIETGISLQLPLYLYSSKKLIDAQLNADFYPLKPIIYSLKLKKNSFGPKTIHISSAKKLDDDVLIKSNEELIKLCNEFIPKYVKDIASGKFNLSTLEDKDKKVCCYCEFKSICRIQDVN